MAQIFIRSMFLSDENLATLGSMLIPVVENEFGIGGKKDTACTAVKAAATIKEAQVQVEIRYTAGRDEYGWGRPFDPTIEEQKRLAAAIKRNFDEYLRLVHLPHMSLSVWCIPSYNSHFEMWD